MTALEANEDVSKLEVVTDILHQVRKLKERSEANPSTESTMTSRKTLTHCLFEVRTNSVPGSSTRGPQVVRARTACHSLLSTSNMIPLMWCWEMDEHSQLSDEVTWC